MQARIAADQRFRRQRIESLNQPRLARVMVGARAPGNESYFSSLSQREEIAGFAPVPGHDWVVGVAIFSLGLVVIFFCVRELRRGGFVR